MADTVTAAAPAIVAEKKAKKVPAAGSKKPKSTPTHPPTQQMVDAAIKTLKERGGSSLLAIKKYIAATYKVDVQKLAPFIKKYLKGAVTSGKLVQTKGKGAAGSFKLSTAANKEPKVKSAEKKKTTKPKSSATGEKKVKKVTGGEKKLKKSTSATASGTKKSVEKKKVEKSKVKSIKKTSVVKAKPTKPKAAAPKAKVPKAKSTTASAAKPKKVAAAKKAKK